jgi:hypothetical protein
MEIIKTTVGHHLTNLFPENVAFDIAAFLAEDPEERRGKEQYKATLAKLYAATKQGKNMKFVKYCKSKI